MSSITKIVIGFLLAGTVFLTITLTGLKLIVVKPVFTLLSDRPFAHDVAAAIFSINIVAPPNQPECFQESCFTTSELGHLVDVRQLFLNLIKTYLVAATATLVSIISVRISAASLLLMLKRISAILVAGLAATTVLGAIFWSRFFILFHVIFFPQGNWSFPADSLLITLYPVEFWQLAAIFLLITHFLIYALILISTHRVSS